MIDRYPPFELERYFARHEFTAKFLLSSSDCETWTAQDLLAMEKGAQEAWLSLPLGYSEASGLPALREAIAATYAGIHASEVLIHTGAEEAIFHFFHGLFGAGDHVIVHAPCYQSLRTLPLSVGAEVTLWQAREEAGWALDLDDLRSALRPDTRAVVVNFPHNPTGFVMSAADQASLVSLCRAHGLWLLSDEVYRGLELSPLDRLPAACDVYEKAVSLGVMSKSYGLAGLRVGWIATRDRTVREAMIRMKDYTTICTPSLCEHLALLAVKHRDRLHERNRSIIEANLSRLDDFFRLHPGVLAWRRPLSGPIAYPAYLGARPVDAFCDEVVREAGVMLLPGSVYGEQTPNVRIGFGRKNLPEALDALGQYLTLRSAGSGV
ncbi:MAG: aminotransferase class I/II-fold pyridoxal phosphate-dependent enzyme [Polyangiales bacterium]